MGGVQIDLLKADDCPVATVNEGLQVRKPSSETTHIPLHQVLVEWRRIDCTSNGKMLLYFDRRSL
jgi:hypothetical protein